ncbi:MAG: polysaccharide biosynthesis C-terminal domain-containing protein [Ignavibacteriaceae bacterium]|nr:polysaccharide biosynthesis C-terminal domain-containing protein [Ignavibacteriaceae bacterium]
MSKKTLITISAASIIILLTGLLSKSLGFLREIVYASIFGLAEQFELFLIGMILPASINSIVLFLSQNYIIPQYRYLINKESKEAAHNFINSSMTAFIILSLVITVLLIFNADFFVGLFINSNEKSFDIAVTVFDLFVLSIPLNFPIAIIFSYLQAEFHFKSPYISQIWPNVFVISTVILFGPQVGVYSIPLGYLGGYALQLIHLLAIARKYLRIDLSLRHFIKGFKFKIFFMTLIAEIIAQSYTIIDRFFYSKVDDGGIAAISYAMIIFLLPISMISMAFSSAILPFFSENFSKDNSEELRENIIKGISINNYLFIPLFFLLFLFSETFIFLFYQRGQFRPEDTILTAQILQIYSWSLIFYAAYAIFNKLIYSMNGYKVILIISILGLTLKAILSVWLVTELKQNGLAFATTASFFFLFLSSAIFIFVKLGISGTSGLWKDLIVSFINAVFSYVVVSFIGSYLPANKITGITIITLFLILYIANSLIIKQTSAIVLIDNLMKFKNGNNK